MIYDLCIVGAGLFGSAAARHASANPALKVVLIGPDEPSPIEWKSRNVYSCHYDEGRITRVLDDDDVYQQLAKEAISRYQEIEKLSGINFYKPVGYISIGEKNGHYLSSVHKMSALGNVPILPLSHELAKERYPFLSLRPSEVAFLDENGSGFISARNLVKAQKKIAEEQGCTIIHDTVTFVSASEKGQLGLAHKIKSETGREIFAKRVLICAGAFTKFFPLIPNVNKWRIKTTVNEETAALVKIPPEEAKRLQRLPGIVYFGTDLSEKETLNAYILPPMQYPNGSYFIKIGHIKDSGTELKTLQDVQNWYNSKGDERISRYVDKLRSVIPGLQELDIVPLICACCYTPNGVPYIDRTSPTVTVATGGNGKGAKISDEVGRLAAELSVHGRWDSKVSQSLFQVVWEK